VSISPLLEDSWALVRANLDHTLSLRRDITWKPDGSPVTQADLFQEKLIADFLRANLPDVTLVAEESYEAGQDIRSGWVAVLDPIDGTENFCSGLKEWGVALSIWRDGVHQGSALMLPEMGDILMSGMTIPTYQSRIVGLSSSYNAEIGAILAGNPEGRVMGCAVYNMYNVIRGAYARFVNPKGAYSWDLLAGVALAHEAGCAVFLEGESYHGQFLDPDKRHRVDIWHRHDLHPGQGPVG